MYLDFWKLARFKEPAVRGRLAPRLCAAGGTTDDILKLTVYLASYRDREALNREWLAMFPDPESRPTRQVMAATFDGATLVQADLTAILDV